MDQPQPPPISGSSPHESVDFEKEQQQSWFCPSSQSSPSKSRASPKEAESPTQKDANGEAAGPDGDGSGRKKFVSPFAATYGDRAEGWVPPSWREPGRELFFSTPPKNEFFIKLQPPDTVPPFRALPKITAIYPGLTWTDKIGDSSASGAAKPQAGRSMGEIAAAARASLIEMDQKKQENALGDAEETENPFGDAPAEDNPFGN